MVAWAREEDKNEIVVGVGRHRDISKDATIPRGNKARKLSDFSFDLGGASLIERNVTRKLMNYNSLVSAQTKAWYPREQAPNLGIEKNGDFVIKVRPPNAPPIFYVNHPFERYLNNRSRNLEGNVVASEDVDLIVDPFQPLRIHVHTSSLLKVGAQNNALYRKRIDFLVNSVLPATKRRWSEALRVVPVQGALRLLGWCPETPSKHIHEGVTGADLILYVNGNGKYCQQGTLAYASACELDQYDRPIAGSITFCLDTIDLGENNWVSQITLETTVETAVHEVAHILAFSDLLMPYFRKPENGEPLTPRYIDGTPVESIRTCIDGTTKYGHLPSDRTVKEGVTASGARFFEVVTPRVATVSRNQFDCQKMAGARLENQPTSQSCFGAHWDERLFYASTMSAVAEYTAGYLDPVTLALFEDSGWYKADYSVAEMSPFGHGAGCSFVYDDCIVNEEIPSYSKGYFCNSPLSIRNGLVEDGTFFCDHSHRSIAMCDMVDVTKISGGQLPPKEFSYFNQNVMAGLMQQIDYCPISSLYNFYCADSINANTKFALTGEYFGEDSKCFNTDISGKPMCLRSRCNEDKNVVEVLVEDTVITCNEDFEMHFSAIIGRSIECPRKSAVCPELFCPANCAGRGRCDFSLVHPRCICFDENDTRPGCFESNSAFANNVHSHGESLVASLALRSSSDKKFTPRKLIASALGAILSFIMLR
eukprot:CAMPEP_0113302822 /NCGR_PEP_ID=MMETSP0010_2-20120614/3491_1 /TAXON_ID=216773 ORGANISM="Corethron hystrix, Strain 308" /NCGR_SAMPLE_ID=MMETSP0010_2 /ASSEMBLY_ACC=CAM_ASM_000155 /LENGTH=706 /DNA_ID=CAMNT_0000156709 /DNA_START=71 /DNA_END=2191 /DNA_ORIENTATION=- /assembly_acc=CAM_ASM_000155